MTKFYILCSLAFATAAIHCRFKGIAEQDYWMTPIFAELLEKTGASRKGPSDLDEAVLLTNQAWQIQGERFNFQDVPDVIHKNGDRIFEIADRLGFVSTKLPFEKHFHRILLIGATTARVKSRMTFACVKTQELDLTFEKLVFLGSTRDLLVGSQADKDLAPKIADRFPVTEHGMQQYLWQEELIDVIPPALKIPTIWVNALPSPGQSRASLVETVQAWLSLDDVKNGMKVLVVSDQPHVPFQQAVIVRLLKERGLSDVSLEMLGEGAKRSENLRVLLDAIRRDLLMRKQLLAP